MLHPPGLTPTDAGRKLPSRLDEKPGDRQCKALWNRTQNHLHRSVWDADMMERQMIAQGFASVTRRTFRHGADARLLVDLEHRAWESLYMEGVR